MVFYTLVLPFIEKMVKRKKRRWCLSEEKTEEKQNRATIMISVDGKGTAFPVKFKLQGE